MPYRLRITPTSTMNAAGEMAHMNYV